MRNLFFSGILLLIVGVLILLRINKSASSLPLRPSPTPLETTLLPDLQHLLPDNLYIQINPISGKREIRFNTTVTNMGKGPLDMIGSPDEKEGKTRAVQRIHMKNGQIKERVAGYFILHPDHNHWHFEDFTEFELYTYKKGGALDKPLTTTGKITSCIWDAGLAPSPPKNTVATPQFPSCDPVAQGISVGWQETYEAWLPGQQLEIEGIPDGRYAIRFTVDPLNRLMETNEKNNSIVGYIQIQGNQIELLPDP